MTILGFDPGRDKCGIAVTDHNHRPIYHQVVISEDALATINRLCEELSIESIVMGNQTTAKSWQEKIASSLIRSIPILMVDERNSTLEARDRYWQMYPPRGLKKLIPQGMRIPPRPVDDIVAILLIERYLSSNK